VLTIDTLRADHVGADGGPAGVTPSLDALGRAGAVFLDATAHVPLTLPSHISIFSGRYPIAHGVHDNGSVAVPESVPMLATVLHATGITPQRSSRRTSFGDRPGWRADSRCTTIDSKTADARI